MGEMHVAGPTEFLLVRSDRRTLGLSVARDGSVTVRAPRRAGLATIATMVERRSGWIGKQRARFAALGPVSPPHVFSEGETHRHLGRDYRLKIERGLREAVRLDGDRLVLTMHRPERMAARATLIERWRMARARETCGDAITRLMPPFAALGHPRPTLTIRALRRRWGSMSRGGAMTLSRDLICAPLAAIDYVVAHELCHLVHFDHGAGFRALIAEICPDHRERRAMLERGPG